MTPYKGTMTQHSTFARANDIFSFFPLVWGLHLTAFGCANDGRTAVGRANVIAPLQKLFTCLVSSQVRGNAAVPPFLVGG